MQLGINRRMWHKLAMSSEGLSGSVPSNVLYVGAASLPNYVHAVVTKPFRISRHVKAPVYNIISCVALFPHKLQKAFSNY